MLEEEKLIEVLDSVTDGVAVLDRDWQIRHLSPKAAVQLQCDPAAVLNRNVWEQFPEAARSEFHARCLESMRTQQPASFEEFYAAANAWFEVHALPDAERLLLCFKNITERKSAEAAQARFVTILEATPDFVSIADTRGRPPYLNRAGRRLLGLGEEEALSHIAYHPKWASDLILGEALPAAIRNGVWTGETALLTRDGREIPVLQVIIAHKNMAGEVEFISTVARDISERKGAEEKLREQAALLDQAQDAILVRDLDHRVLFWSRGAQQIYGWTAAEALGHDIRDLIYPRESLARFAEAAEQLWASGEWTGEVKHTAKDRREIMVYSHWSIVRDAAGSPKSIFIINTDITEKKRLEEQFLRAQRMESIGTLASGIAHDLNNVLAPILLGIRILGLKHDDAESQQLLAALRRSAERGASLVRQVLTFARGAIGERQPLQAQPLIKEFVKILSDTLPKAIQIKLALPSDLWLVLGDTTQLYQVIMNLCVNARDAMPDGGQLTITAENTEVDEESARLWLEAKPGRYVLLSVRDTGVGIPPENLARIFEPFFTTKAQGEGTGLGLATVAGIVKGHGGFIQVASEPGRGTSFKIYLPAVVKAEAQPSETVSADLPSGAGETVLIIDDEDEICQLTGEILTVYGYQVLVAKSGAEAIALMRENPERISAALVDLIMPEMGGLTLIKELRRLTSVLKIIAVSGLEETDRIADALAAGANAFVAKPFPTDKLLHTLARLTQAEKNAAVSGGEGQVKSL